jgi:uncharacterized protein YjiS (DUF1127 family)
MCIHDKSALDYRGLTPEQWQRERQRILSRAQAARAQALRQVAGTVVHPLQVILAGAAAALHDLAEGAAARAGKWWRAYALRRERNAAVRELHALDDRTLKDIGVSRSEIEWVVRGQDATRLRDATIAANRCRQRHATAGSSMTAKPQRSTKHAIQRHAA